MIPTIGYCTNVHAGNSLSEVKSNLQRFAIPVRDKVAGDGLLGVGLWLSQTAASELTSVESQREFHHWLAERRLDPYTFNGFPFGDFHQDVVKHQVYAPTWAADSRLEYTKQLARIQATVLNERDYGTISTLPLGWPSSGIDDSFLAACGQRLLELTEFLGELEQESGKTIRVCIEPEPGCVLDTAIDIVSYFEKYLFKGTAEKRARRFLGVCHDVCHSAVMFEPQELAVDLYSGAGIEIGKVQVSSAVEANFQAAEANKEELLTALSEFQESRYLHQTSVLEKNEVQFFEDLPEAIGAAGREPRGVWRVHFHVPIFQAKFNSIQTTQSDICDLLSAMNHKNLKPHFEIETYAWSVLPSEFQGEGLETSISREIEWFQERLLEQK